MQLTPESTHAEHREWAQRLYARILCSVQQAQDVQAARMAPNAEPEDASQSGSVAVALAALQHTLQAEVCAVTTPAALAELGARGYNRHGRFTWFEHHQPDMEDPGLEGVGKYIRPELTTARGYLLGWHEEVCLAQAGRADVSQTLNLIAGTLTHLLKAGRN